MEVANQIRTWAMTHDRIIVAVHNKRKMASTIGRIVVADAAEEEERRRPVIGIVAAAGCDDGSMSGVGGLALFISSFPRIRKQNQMFLASQDRDRNDDPLTTHKARK
jgi:hypothetical protein